MSKNRAVISYVMKENLLRKIQKRNKTKQQKVNFLLFFGEIEMIFFQKNSLISLRASQNSNPNYVKTNKQTFVKCLKSNVKIFAIIL